MPSFERRRILSPLCIPVSPPGRHAIIGAASIQKDEGPALTRGLETGGATESRTRLIGFAIRCITALLSRHDAGLSRHSNSRQEKGKHSASLFQIWSGRRVSNSRPQPWQGCALPTELLPHVLRFQQSSHYMPISGLLATSRLLYVSESTTPTRRGEPPAWRHRQRPSRARLPGAHRAPVRAQPPAPDQSTAPARFPAGS